MKSDGRDLLAHFRALAPERRPISLQTWGPRRVLLALGVAVVTVLALVNVYFMFTPAELPIDSEPACGTDEVIVLMAQAVPTASAVPCIAALPAGWDVGGVRVNSDNARFWLDSDHAGNHAVEVRLRPLESCTLAGATEVPSDEVGMRRFERSERSASGSQAVRTHLNEGACVTYEFHFDGDPNASEMVALDAALSFQPRDELVRRVDDRSGLILCGAGATACVGGE